MMKKLAVFACASLFSGFVLAGTATPPLPPEPVDEVDEKGRFIVCHKERKTLAVEGEESKADHVGHGDTLGACAD